VADLIKKTFFERPSQPQSAPLGKVPLGLLEVQDFYAAWYSETQSFRSKLPAGDRFYILDTQPAFSWLAEPLNLLDVFTVPKFPAMHAQTQSFRALDHGRLDVRSQQWIQSTEYIAAVVVVDLFTIPKFPAIYSQTQSFMVADRKRFDVHNYIWNQEISYIRPVINPAPIDVNKLFVQLVYEKRRR